MISIFHTHRNFVITLIPSIFTTLHAYSSHVSFIMNVVWTLREYTTRTHNHPFIFGKDMATTVGDDYRWAPKLSLRLISTIIEVALLRV